MGPFSQVLLCLIGSFLSAGICIWWAKRDRARDEKKERDILFKELTNAVKFNLDRAEQMCGELRMPEWVPNYPLDTARFTIAIARASGKIKEDLLRRIDWQRYQLDHINQKASFVYFAGVSGMNPEAARAERESWQGHLERTINDLRNVLSEIEKAMAENLSENH
jgi:hypothetical protein